MTTEQENITSSNEEEATTQEPLESEVSEDNVFSEHPEHTEIEYKAVGDAIQEMENIAVELERFWKLEDVLLIRRTGHLAVGDIISLVAASSPNSNDTFDACKFGINRLRRMVTIVKREKLGEIK